LVERSDTTGKSPLKIRTLERAPANDNVALNSIVKKDAPLFIFDLHVISIEAHHGKAAIPPGWKSWGMTIRWCRFAQPPATGWDASGIQNLG
jgi:hypothetical protein